MEKLIRIDKNGTKYYESDVCPKCNGTGHLACYDYIEGGVCFMCDGSGKHYHTWTVRTPEYEEKLAERRLKKAIKKAPELNRAFFKTIGFSEDGKCYVVTGNTYDIKDELKEQGAFYSPVFGWHFSERPEKYDSVEVDISEVGYRDETERWHLSDDAYEYVKEKKLREAPKTESDYIGSVGEKITCECDYVGRSEYYTNFTHYGETVYLYRFSENGNVIVWKTSKNVEFSEGKRYALTGTVKEHKEYGGNRETVIIRAKAVFLCS